MSERVERARLVLEVTEEASDDGHWAVDDLRACLLEMTIEVALLRDALSRIAADGDDPPMVHMGERQHIAIMALRRHDGGEA